MTQIAVLGGGSPFTAALLRALVQQPCSRPDHVRLWGGDERSLGLLAGHGSALLGDGGGSARVCRELGEAVHGADVVVHQVRYGSLAGRAAAEALATRWGVPPDETLGPGGLLTALITAAGLVPVAQALREHAPGVPVITMTNPLGVSTSVLRALGVPGVLGSCELPEVTARAAFAAAGCGYRPEGWRTTGLNHRGFVHDLRDADGTDLLPAVVRGLRARGDRTAAQDVVELDAVPTKYFDLVRGRRAASAGRAEALTALRTRVLRELEADVRLTPSSLQERPTPWYDLAVVPLVRALRSPQARRLVLTVPREDGLSVERECSVSSSGAAPTPAPPPPPAVVGWLRRFEDHERAVLAAVAEPSVGTVTEALRSDPSTSSPDPAACAADLLARLPPGAYGRPPSLRQAHGTTPLTRDGSAHSGHHRPAPSRSSAEPSPATTTS